MISEQVLKLLNEIKGKDSYSEVILRLLRSSMKRRDIVNEEFNSIKSILAYYNIDYSILDLVRILYGIIVDREYVQKQEDVIKQLDIIKEEIRKAIALIAKD